MLCVSDGLVELEDVSVCVGDTVRLGVSVVLGDRDIDWLCEGVAVSEGVPVKVELSVGEGVRVGEGVPVTDGVWVGVAVSVIDGVAVVLELAVAVGEWLWLGDPLELRVGEGE